MKQTKFSEEVKTTPSLNKPYAKGPYNKFDDQEQWIRITEGCPNNCEYCRETKENGAKPKYFEVPNIVRNSVKIMDMNLMYKADCIEILDKLGSQRVNSKIIHYELVCGIDYRFMNQEKANALKRNRFKHIRLAWDHSIKEQKKIKECIKQLVTAGYRSEDIMVFMICNWRIPYEDNCMKLRLCLRWNVKAADCWFDNQLPPNVKPIHWSHKQIKQFRKDVRVHNQLINFGIYPELK